jgi:glycosyltransferase involved in cell wall biosynthesis
MRSLLTSTGIAPGRLPADASAMGPARQGSDAAPCARPSVVAPGHVFVTVNASWNLVNFRRGLVAALLADGHRVTVLAPPDGASGTLEAMGCRFLPLVMDNKGVSPLRDLALLWRIVRILRRERPDAILGYTIKNNVYGGIAARLLGIPFLPNVSGLGTGFLSGTGLRALVVLLYRLGFAKAELVFFQNEDDRALFVGERLVTLERTRCLPGSGIDLARFAPAPARNGDEAVIFLLIARLLRDKGVCEFVEAARIVRRRHPGAVFQLLGPAGAANRTAIPDETLAAWHAEGIVVHLGETDDVRPFIAAADCVVLPSYREGRPRSLIEAAAMARPVIATDVPGCRDVVEAGRTGLLCRVRDAADLARRMEEFIALPPATRAEMGRQARARMERDYDERLVVAAYREALRGLGLGPTERGDAGEVRLPARRN